MLKGLQQEGLSGAQPNKMAAIVGTAGGALNTLFRKIRRFPPLDFPLANHKRGNTLT